MTVPNQRAIGNWYGFAWWLGRGAELKTR